MNKIKLTFHNLLLVNIFSILILTIQSCSNQQFGKELSESFDSSQDLVSNNGLNKSSKINNRKEAKLNEATIKKKSTRINSLKKVESLIPEKEDKEIERKKILNKSFAKKNKIKKDKVQNYLFTIKIFGANSSSPGEVITNTLMREGIDFEVEKIEKIDN
tara:strand:+ start:1643 stop:2122 length:480 start_codon:yes stop_codon:yes gene_type:complete